MSSEEIPDPVDDAPPATKFVFKELRDSPKPLTTSEICEETYLPERTVQRSLERLIDARIVESGPHPSEPKTPQYRTTEWRARED